ncbi:MAG: excinuclease ABC subunit UvrC [Nitrospirae bacterium]|nr:excinuclease ABC subunit UvrC [Candidatus Manganitrophaceae bacterium]
MELKHKIEALPHNPGVYLMKGKRGEVLYIGKAKDLSDRVRSYFRQSAELSPKTRSMVSQVADLEYIVAATNLEALILESNLIKKHRPKYNVVLRDDKNYPLLRLDPREDYPRLEIVRRVKKDGALYFGPYVPTGGLYEMLRLLRKIFPLPNCTIDIDGKADRACIEFEIKRCLAPCTGNQSKEEYRQMIQQVRLFLEGKDKILLKAMRGLMERKAGELNFEAAARLRDQIAKIERALERQRVTLTQVEDHDVIALAREGEAADLQILFIRGGMMVGRKDFFFENVGETLDEELITAFIQQFYNKEGLIPREILVPIPLTEAAVLEEWLSERRGGPVHLLSPSRGKGAHLLDFAVENARASLSDHVHRREGGEETLRQLQELLQLSKLPRRIEGYDISNIMGTDAVGSMVVFEEAKAKKSDYRHFRIKTIEGANDFGMMAEVLTRRVAALKEKGEAPPDLFLIDGGKGQLSAVREVLEKADLGGVDLIGLAKEREDRFERVYLPDLSDPIELPVGSPATHLLQQVRDEAHRFAVSYHRKIRDKRMLASPLQEIEGIGKTRRLALLRHFGSVSKIRAATVEELATAPSMNKKAAQQLFDTLHPAHFS